jgi:hypothetical protein
MARQFSAIATSIGAERGNDDDLSGDSRGARTVRIGEGAPRP